MVCMWTIAIACGAALLATISDAQTFYRWYDYPPSSINDTMGTRSAYFSQTQWNEGILAGSQGNKYFVAQIQPFIRHGAHFPFESNVLAIEALVATLQRERPQHMPKWLLTYKLPYNVSVEGQLAPSGVKELEGLASRLRSHVNLLVPDFNREPFVFQHTYKARTKQSAAVFAPAFFRKERTEKIRYVEQSATNDPLLRFYDHCPRYKRDVLDNPNVLDQRDEFLRGKLMRGAVSELRHYLNGRRWSETEFSFIGLPELQTVYTACAYDIALYGRLTDWCSLLTREKASFPEFANDLEIFALQGGRYPINYEMASGLLQDVMRNMRTFLEGKPKLRANFRFVESEALVPLLTLLGYTDKTPMKADWTWQTILGRTFRTSNFMPFAANVVFYMYARPSIAGVNDYSVQIRVDEKVVSIPGCGVFCNIDAFEKIYASYLKTYNFDKECAVV